jgi:hypothetical protein
MQRQGPHPHHPHHHPSYHGARGGGGGGGGMAHPHPASNSFPGQPPFSAAFTNAAATAQALPPLHGIAGSALSSSATSASGAATPAAGAPALSVPARSWRFSPAHIAASPSVADGLTEVEERRVRRAACNHIQETIRRALEEHYRRAGPQGKHTPAYFEQ